MLLSVIIVNYKSAALTMRCINSCYKYGVNDMEIIVVDNYSNDGSIESIENEFKDVLIIENNENEGFGRANNLGLNNSKGKYVLFLNSDMILLENTLSVCISELEKNTKIGVLGCKLLNEDLSPQKSKYYDIANYRDVLKTNLLFDKIFNFNNGEVKGLMGAFMLVPRVVLDKTGGFHSTFFMYSEELELNLRIAQSGYLIHYTENAIAVHRHGGSTADDSWSFLQKKVSNQLFYRIKNGPFGYLFFLIVTIFNHITNFFLMWFLDKGYRSNFWKEVKCDLKSLKYFFIVLFYKRTLLRENKYLKVSL